MIGEPFVLFSRQTGKVESVLKTVLLLLLGGVLVAAQPASARIFPGTGAGERRRGGNCHVCSAIFLRRAPKGKIRRSHSSASCVTL